MFVGDVKIPFTTLYCNGGTEGFVEGTFRLRTPTVRLSQDCALQKSAGDANENQDLRSAANASTLLLADASKAVYVHVAIFLRPPLVLS